MTSTVSVGGMSDVRRERLRLEISREAGRLFWQQGVTATSGEQIAEAVGLSVRTIWRHFRSKEACAEPVVGHSVEWFLEVMRRWPRDRSLEAHMKLERIRLHERRAERATDDLVAAQMIVLASTEPAIRSAWLLACHRVEQEMAPIIADRLRRPADDPDVRLHAAAATAVVRVISEQWHTTNLTSGRTVANRTDLDERLAQAVHASTGGAVGDAVGP